MFTDKTLMPWGMHKGKPLATVPDSYLLWLYTENKAHGALRDYIKNNLASINTNIQRQLQTKKYESN